MSVDDNKETVLAYVEALNRGDLETLPSLFTEDARIWGVFGRGSLQKILPLWRDLHDAFAMTLEVMSMIAEDNCVAVRYVERGISRAPFRDQPATGMPYEIHAMEWFELNDGRIQRRWGTRDATSIFSQMGLARP